MDLRYRRSVLEDNVARHMKRILGSLWLACVNCFRWIIANCCFSRSRIITVCIACNSNWETCTTVQFKGRSRDYLKGYLISDVKSYIIVIYYPV